MKTPFFDRALVRIRAIIKKKNLCGKALVRKRAKIEQKSFLVGVCLE